MTMSGALISRATESAEELELRQRNAETIFGAIADRDPGVIAGGVLFATFFFVLANLLVDLGYAWVDPRVRLGE